MRLPRLGGMFGRVRQRSFDAAAAGRRWRGAGETPGAARSRRRPGCWAGSMRRAMWGFRLRPSIA